MPTDGTWLLLLLRIKASMAAAAAARRRREDNQKEAKLLNNLCFIINPFIVSLHLSSSSYRWMYSESQTSTPQGEGLNQKTTLSEREDRAANVEEKKAEKPHDL